VKNILITGGAGFLGSHLVENLIQNKENNIIVIDNFITSDFYNIENFVRQPNFELIKQDITKNFNLDNFDELGQFKLKVYGIEEIYHFACPTSPKNFDKLPLETCLANSHGTKNILDIAKRYQSKFLFSSASAVYGKVPAKDQPVLENHRAKITTLGPRACYIDGKRFAENLIIYYAAQYNFPVKIARIFHTYGPKMRLGDGRLIADFIAKALKNQPIKIPGNKKTTRTLCYIKDMIDGLIKFMQSDETGPINFGATQLYKVEDIAQVIIDIIGSSSKISYDKPLPFRNPEPIPNIKLAQEKLDWMPITPPEEGLVQTVKAMQASQIMKFNQHQKTSL